MTLSVDLFYSYRSPYSYLALPRTTQLVAEYDLAVNLRPVYPLAVRVPDFFKRTNPKFLRYVGLDARRVAEHLRELADATDRWVSVAHAADGEVGIGLDLLTSRVLAL